MKTIDAGVALRHLADSVGYMWKKMLNDDCEGLGHIHDLWNEMYKDMESLVILEEFIVEHDKENGSGVDFVKHTRGFSDYADGRKGAEE